MLLERQRDNDIFIKDLDSYESSLNDRSLRYDSPLRDPITSEFAQGANIRFANDVKLNFDDDVLNICLNM